MPNHQESWTVYSRAGIEYRNDFNRVPYSIDEETEKCKDFEQFTMDLLLDLTRGRKGKINGRQIPDEWKLKPDLTGLGLSLALFYRDLP